MIVLEPVIRVRELPPARSKLRQHLPSIRELVWEMPSHQERLLLPRQIRFSHIIARPRNGCEGV